MGKYYVNEMEEFRHITRKILPSIYDDSLSYDELLSKVMDAVNKMLTDLKTMCCEICHTKTHVSGIEKSVRELQEYVSDYFKNLDVQQQINNKLNEMANDGTIATLFSESFVYYVTPEMFGAVGDDVTDDYQAIQDCIDYAYVHNLAVEFAKKTYKVSDTVKLYGKCVYNGNNCTIRQTSDVPVMASAKYFDDSKGAYNITINDFWLEGDTNNTNNDGLIICGWFARVNNVNVRNVGGHGIVITTYSSEGNEFSGTTMVEGMICNSMGKSVNPNKYPFYVHCNNVVITDWRVENCIFSAVDAPAFMMMERISGWFLTDVQCYGKAEYGIRSMWASGTQIENVILDGVSYIGMAIYDQLGSTNASNININVRPEVTGNFIAINQEGGSGRPALLSVINIHVNVPTGTTPARLILQSGSSYIFDVTNPCFMQSNAELDYELYSYKGSTDVYRLNGFEVVGNKPNSDILPTLAKHYSMERYTATSETLTLTIAPPYTIKRGGLLVIIGEVNGDSKGNSVYSIGLMRRGTNQPCRLVSEQTGYEFTNVSVRFNSTENTYTISATTPATSNCTYTMSVVY